MVRAILFSGLMLFSAASFAQAIEETLDDCNLKALCAQISATPYVPKPIPTDPKKIEERLKEIEIQARMRLAAVFLKGRDMAQFSPDEKSAFQAMASLPVVTLAEEPKCKAICDLSTMGYYTGLNAMCICPSALKYDDEYLIFSLAHEMGHIGGICAQLTGLRPGQHPFAATGAGESVVQCLEKNGMSIRSSALPVPGTKTVPWIRWIMGGDAINDITDENKCIERDKMMNEATADVVGFEVLADYMKDHPRPPGAETFRRMFGLFAERGCRNNSPANREHQQKLGHPADLDRIEKVALSLPSIRRALGCKPEMPVHNCEYQPAGVKRPVGGTGAVR